ncbi:MAG TPA: zf-HC2 domain-containing protein [Gemmatimonadales bacterium]|nr:zf-HC2 domain-containing protein [Gemmatimonadales bacterium]
MPHVDEGTLHALLDGELAPAELAEVRLHFATCPSCAGRLDEARQLLAETERLVSALQMPGAAAAGAAARAAAGRVVPRTASPEQSAVNVLVSPPPPGAPLPPLDPVVLIPENPTVREVRHNRMRIMAWAAGFLVVVGAGYLGMVNLPRKAPSGDGRLRISPDEFTTVPATLEREGLTRDSFPTISLTDSAKPGGAVPPDADAKAKPADANLKSNVGAQAAPPAAAPAAPPAQQRRAPTPPSTDAPAPSRAAETREDASPRRAEESKDDSPQLAKVGPAGAEPPAEQNAARNTEEQSVAREAAAKATSDLERRRIRERAAAATAELDRENARRAAERERQLALEQARVRAEAEPAAATRPAAPAPAPAAAPDRTGLTSRIGLDEAARQLGGPLHAIDGLFRQTVGLVPGSSVAGADPDRDVVRAVYVERATGTMIFLDQQMAQPGDGPSTPRAGPGGRQLWVKDGVLLILHGDVPADSLRSLARRVR